MGVGAIIGGVAAAGIGAAGQYAAADAARPGGFYPARDARHWIDAFRMNAPTLYDLERQMRPGYSGLERIGAQQFLEGTEARGDRVPILYRDSNGKLLQKFIHVKRPATPGLLDLVERAQPRMEDLYFGSTWRGLGEARGAADWLDPEGQGLGDELVREARQGLSLGSALDPATRRELQQAVRAAQTSRGMGLGPGDAAEEAMTIGSAAEARRRMREQFAMGVNAGRPNMMSMAMDRFSGAPGLGLAAVGSAFGLNAGIGPRLGMNPWNSPGLTPANNAGANALAAGSAGLMGLGGNLIGYGMANRGAQPVAGPGNQTYYPRDNGSWYSANPGY